MGAIREATARYQAGAEMTTWPQLNRLMSARMDLAELAILRPVTGSDDEKAAELRRQIEEIGAAAYQALVEFEMDKRRKM